MFATDYIYPDNRDNTKWNELCDLYGKKSIKMTILFVSFILLSTAQAMIGPMIEFMKTGNLITFLAIKLPFINEDIVWGFHLNLALQTTITTFGTIGGIAIETTSCIINNTVMLCSEIISLDCIQLGDDLEMETASKTKIVSKLRNIFMKYQDMDRYILEMCDLYYWRMFSAPILIVYSVSISIFCQYAVNILPFTICPEKLGFFNVSKLFKQLGFPCGYGFAILTYAQLIIICYMGNNVCEAVRSFSSEFPRIIIPQNFLFFEKNSLE